MISWNPKLKTKNLKQLYLCIVYCSCYKSIFESHPRVYYYLTFLLLLLSYVAILFQREFNRNRIFPGIRSILIDFFSYFHSITSRLYFNILLSLGFLFRYSFNIGIKWWSICDSNCDLMIWFWYMRAKISMSNLWTFE